MTIYLNFSMVKRSQSRRPRYNYSMISVTRRLDQMGWTWYVNKHHRMILFFYKTFESMEEAIQAKKEMERLFPCRMEEEFNKVYDPRDCPEYVAYYMKHNPEVLKD